MLTLWRRFSQRTSFACQRSSIATCLQSFIVQNTEIVSDHLTPELRLHLLTPRCKHWHLPSHLWPYGDPYWAFYWPGGQALARYILDYPHIVQNKRILDLGCGCGAAAIASKMGGASYVLANDIDPVAGAAFSLNCQLNNLKPLAFSPKNLIAQEGDTWNLIVLGDMFYDEKLSDHLNMWLKLCISKHGTKVLIGDPGRHQFVSHSIQKQLQKVEEYSLLELTQEENYGLTTSAVFCFEP